MIIDRAKAYYQSLANTHIKLYESGGKLDNLRLFNLNGVRIIICDGYFSIFCYVRWDKKYALVRWNKEWEWRKEFYTQITDMNVDIPYQYQIGQLFDFKLFAYSSQIEFEADKDWFKFSIYE